MLPGFRTHVSRVVSVGRIEGVSTLLLFFVAMPVRTFAGMDWAVTYMGWTHGMLFLTLALVTFIAWRAQHLSFNQSTLVAIGALVPFGPFIVERWLPQEGFPEEGSNPRPSPPSSPPTEPTGDDGAAGES